MIRTNNVIKVSRTAAALPGKERAISTPTSVFYNDPRILQTISHFPHLTHVNSVNIVNTTL